MTVAELKYGVETSKDVEGMRENCRSIRSKVFCYSNLQLVRHLCQRKSETEKTRFMIDDFDILIDSISVAHNLIIVTNNVAHLSRLDNIIIEDWTALAKK